MSTQQDQLEALQELAREYGLRVVITAEKPTRRPKHSNAGKNYRTKKAILTDLAEARKEWKQISEEQYMRSELILDTKKQIAEEATKANVIQEKINALTAEATKKGATAKDLESTRSKRKYVKRK
jgi:hypothetical protein